MRLFKKKKKAVWKKMVIRTFGGTTIISRIPEDAIQETLKDYSEFSHKLLMSDVGIIDTVDDFVRDISFVHDLRKAYRDKYIHIDEVLKFPVSDIASLEIKDIPEDEKEGWLN